MFEEDEYIDIYNIYKTIRATLLEGIPHFADSLRQRWRRSLWRHPIPCCMNKPSTRGHDAGESSAGPACSARCFFRASQSPGLITLITHSSCREFDAPEPSKARLTKIMFLYADLDLQVDIVCVCRIDLSGRYWYLDAETCELKTIYTAQYLRPSRSFT